MPTGAVARWVVQLREWSYQRKHGTHEDRRADMLQAIAGLAGGQELLDKAASFGTPVYVRHPRLMKNGFGYATPPRPDRPSEVCVTNNGDREGMSLTGLHELRHVTQFDDPYYKENDDAFAVSRARAVFMTRMMGEADACTVETLAAVKQQAEGNSAFVDDLNKRRTPVYRTIQKFIRENPLDSFKSDAAFCRSLFTELMIDGLDHYKYQFLNGQSIPFRLGTTLEKFNEITAGKNTPAADHPVDGYLGKAYGSDFATATSMKALQTAFFAALPARERDVLMQMEKTAIKAAKGKLTEEQFAEARTGIIARVNEIYFTEDADAALYKWSVKGDATRQALRDAARAGKPVPLQNIVRAGKTSP